MSLRGGLLKLGYRLQWHRVGPLALGYWPLLIGLPWLGIPWLVSASPAAAWPYALALSLLGLALVGVMWFARQQRYIRFRRDESLAAHLPPDVDLIEPDEKILIRATGVFEVRDKRRYFVETVADFATMETREHAIMARISLSRMWLVAQSSKGVVGWWYVFIEPAYIRSIQTGWLHHGLHPRPALKIEYQRRRAVKGRKKTKEVKSDETIYLSTAEPLALHRLLENLARNAGRADDTRLYVPL